ncbi:hypothetical protein HYPSUDRAFT_128265 [Hypholoma sublateritium FD-334 SS-4]|uniref:Calcineurin-like phosphoesterase domain-containing protein n=1 Tax=Hypholoma sublateritium (strain FD-334 SS-4) TaxID=945553 RepID=A0A0D2QBD3_HYPSF|nr:hypothetical protein HYPSUDRAFT_128265 [Hypholoma sublateritium FD-334 SS-4]
MAALARRHVVVNVLRIFWVLVISWYEYGTFSSSVRSCTWPGDQADHTSIESRPARVLLIADPQIIDRNSYPQRGSLSAYLTRLIVDLNLRKNWHAAVKKDPDVVVFLGDMMDNGRSATSDGEYERYFARFKDIFKMDQNISQYYIPGNHDVGLGKAIYTSANAHSRYVEHFGEPNREISVANHSLILFDAPGYADEDSQRYGQKKSLAQWVPRRGGALEFVNKFAKDKHVDPVVLFSHIPLYRSDGKNCGPLRERGTIRPGVGPGYQNILEKQSSTHLLEMINPVVIFSGDDHDYCEYIHESRPPKPPHTVREVTVKTLSMVMNVRRPGFQLLSLFPAEMRAEGLPTYADMPCLLPDQLRIYINIYLPLLALSVLAVFLTNAFGSRHAFHNKTSSELDATSIFQANIEEPEQDDSDVNSRYASVPRGYQNNLTSRSSRSSGWFVLPGPRRQTGAGNSSLHGWLDQLRESLCFHISSKRPRRRTVLTTTLLDARDIAIFPLATFVLITWWVVTR